MNRHTTKPRDFIPIAAPTVGAAEVEMVAEAVRSGWLALGRHVQEFEQRFAAYCGLRHGVAVSSGTAALHVTLAALGIGPGDEVIIPTLTHISCANVLKLVGATPILVDSDPTTWGLDPSRLANRVSDRTRAILVVHLYGHPVDMDPVLAVARTRGLTVIEDAAEAHGAAYKGRHCGALGHVGCFSFYANKILTTGEGGMMVTADDGLAARGRKLRDQAYETDRRFWHRELGFNYRLTNVQAAIGLAQLRRLDEFIVKHREHARLYDEFLADLPGIRRPPSETWARNVYWMYSVLVEPASGTTSPRLASALRQRGIDTRPFFVPIHLQPLYAQNFPDDHHPVAERLATEGLSLPSGNDLTEDELCFVARNVREIVLGGNHDA